MVKRGVKPGTKRVAYRKKTRAELDAERLMRKEEALALLPGFLEPKGFQWTQDWRSMEMLTKAYLCSFAGLTTKGAASILQAPESEILEALKAIPELKSHWDKGQEDIVSKCHLGLARRIDGMTIKEIRKREYFNEKGVACTDTTTILKELPPDVDAIKFFLTNRVQEYRDANQGAQFEGRLDSMLGRLEQMDLFG